MQSENKQFPCWCIEFESDIEEPNILIKKFTEIRPNSNWVILGEGVAASERQLWSAWISLGRKVKNKTMMSKTEDVEFLRLIAGTHQIRLALERTGVRPSDRTAWIAYLPEWDEKHLDDPILVNLDWNLKEKELQRILLQLDCKPKQLRPHPTELGIQRLEINIENTSTVEEIEMQFLLHIACADLNLN